MEAPVRHCPHCGSVLPSGLAAYCPSCGVAVSATNTSRFPVFRVRWLFLAMVVGVLLSIIGTRVLGDYSDYLVPWALSLWAVSVIAGRRISFGRLVGRIPKGYNWWPILLLAIAGVVYSIGAIVVVLYPLASRYPDIANEFPSYQYTGSRLHYFILAVVVAPLVEEMVFRGLLFSRLTVTWGMTRAMLLSSALFGMLHLDPIGAFVFGIVACVLYVRTRTLMVPIVFHALTNGIVIGFTYLEREQAYPSPEFWTQFVYQGLVAMLIASPVVFALLGRWWPPRGTQLPYEANLPIEQQLAQ